MSKKQNYTRAEARRMEAASLTKMIAIVGFVVAVIAFSSIAWFTMNREVEGEGVQMKSGGDKYVISSIDAVSKSNGKYYSPYHELVRQATGSSAMVWEMTSDYNMENYSNSSVGIKPGSSGKIAFTVTPSVDNINLDFEFEIIGYMYEQIPETDAEGETVTDENGDTIIASEVMNPFNNGSNDEKKQAIANYLNGHILLFENRIVETTTVDDETISRNIYSGLIASNSDMKRVLNKRITGANTKQQITIYWVWPETLSTLVDARDCQKMKIEQVPFTAETDEKNTRTAILQSIQNYPQYYLKNVTRTVTVGENESEIVTYNVKDNTVNELSNTEITTNYDIYGDLYDQVDNEIGMSVQYLLLKMHVAENTGTP